MNAKELNDSYRGLFLGGGLGILWSDDTPAETPVPFKIPIRFGPKIIEECPCGCGLEGEICQDHAAERQRASDELPF
jgi:hypothetical protein